MSASVDDIWPTELRVKDDGQLLVVTFDDGRHVELSAEYLRVESPSAEVQGHAASERRTVAGKQNVRIRSATPVGNYAVKLTFDDGHDSGLFTWRYLSDLGATHDAKWQAYLTALAEKDLSR